MLYDTRQCVRRAFELLGSPTPASVRYAALELRTCMELHTYAKLRTFTGFLPDLVLGTWQPPQAIKMLLEFEEAGDQSYTVEIGVEVTPGAIPDEMLVLGQHNALPLKWLRKHYNKVGSLLHAPIDLPTSFPLDEHVKYLTSVAEDLANATNGNIFGGRFTDSYRFVCQQCGKTVARNRAAVKAGKTALCFTPGCDAEYRPTSVTEESASFEPVVTSFKCVECTAEVNISNRKLQLGVVFECPSCKKWHTIVGHYWRYAGQDS